MKKLVDDARLIFKCCCLYYQDGLGQQEICQRLGISRPTVSRMLNLGRERGIVRIELRNPDNEMFGQMERDLEQKFDLQEVVIVQSSPIQQRGKDGERPQMDIGRAALRFLSRILNDGDYVGVTMGLTIQSIVQSDYFINERISCTFVPLVGGIGESQLEIHSNYLAQKFASRFGGSCVQFFLPAVLSRKGVLAGIMKENMIQRVVRLYQKLDVVVLGIGIPFTESSTIFRTGYVDHEILDRFHRMGAVGDIALRYFDIHGDTKPFDDFNERVAGISLDQMKKVSRRIGVASGIQKAEAVLGAIRGGYINILITDIDCANRLVELDAGKVMD